MSDPVVARAKSQGRWMLVGEVATRVAQFLGSIVLARLLVPEHFGLVSIAIAVWEIVAMFGNTGIYATLVHRTGELGELTGAAFWLNATVAVVVAAAALVVSFGAGRFYDEPLLVPFMALFAVAFLIRALGTVNTALLARDLAFRRLATTEAVAEIARAAGQVAMALAGYGPWSLVVPAPAAELLKVALLWWLQPFRPGLELRRGRWRELYSYGRYILGYEICAYVNAKIAYLVSGKLLGSGPLGIYLRGERLSGLLMESGSTIAAKVAFPTLSAVQEDRDRMADVFRKLLRTAAIVVLPAACVAYATAGDAIAVLYGEERWGAAVPIVRVLAFYGAARMIGLPASMVLFAVGRARLAFRLQLIWMVPLLIAVVIGARYDVLGVAIAVAVCLGALWLTLIGFSCHAAGVSLGSGLRAASPGGTLGVAALLGTALGSAIGPLAFDLIVGAGASAAALAAAPGEWSRVALQGARLFLSTGAGFLAAWLALRVVYPLEHRYLMERVGLRQAFERLRGAGS